METTIQNDGSEPKNRESFHNSDLATPGSQDSHPFSQEHTTIKTNKNKPNERSICSATEIWQEEKSVSGSSSILQRFRNRMVQILRRNITHKVKLTTLEPDLEDLQTEFIALLKRRGVELKPDNRDYITHVCLVYNTSRVKEFVKATVEHFKGEEGLVIVLCHNRYDDALPIVPTKHKVTDIIKDQIIIDMGYKMYEGFYDGKTNENAIQELLSIFRRKNANARSQSCSIC